MTIAEYAERVLFAETLEEKLEILPTADMTDEGRGGKSVASPSPAVEPGRPESLKLRERGITAKTPLPSRAQLIDEQSRGVLFHFFGNHELMAAELMALALLRFPDAPPAFRRGLMQTMRDEQRHTLWYLRRMRDCGVEFGTHSLSRFFWDSVAPMETPLDYVTRLSLTFEQANLDYARHFAGILRTAGDETSAKLLDQIYRDEIAHVGYGLKWFRKWKREGQTDWEAYRESLIFPLSPSRAKGNGTLFNREGRIAAGLEPEFVGELGVFERSKGRAPNVFWFNPDAETIMARGLDGGGYESTRSVAGFVGDLECLPLFLARRDDVVLVREMPRRQYLERVQGLGFDLPEFEVVADDTALAADSLIAGRRLHDLRPWSWEPRAAELLAPLRERLPGSAETPRWSESLRQLFSKSEQMKRWPCWLADESETASPRSFAVSGAEQIAAARKAIQAAWGGDIAVVWKPAFAAAGRGFRLIEPDGDDSGGYDGGADRVESAAEGVLEPWVERVFDFSVQFEVGAGGELRRLGFTRQHIAGTGRYRSTILSPKFCRGLDAELARFLMREALPRYEDEAPFPNSLREWLAEADYRGPVGVDAFVYRDREGELAHRVVCEVNPRHTMGRLARELSRRISAGHASRFSIEKRGGGSWEDEVSFDRHGKISAGTVALTDVESETAWVAVLRVAREVADLSDD